MIDRVNKFSDLIAYVESSYFPKAIRFEERMYRILKSHDNEVKKICELNMCSFNTGCMIGATSWGLYQLLGYNIYIILGYEKNIFDFLKDLTEQKELFERFVEKIADDMKYKTFVEKVITELELLFNFIDAKANPDFLKPIFMKNKNRLKHIARFVHRYNGARIGSEAFFSYIRRMMIFYNRVYM